MSHPDSPAPRRAPRSSTSPDARACPRPQFSFAVNDRPGVSSGTRERILAAARELGWQPSASARALTEARTRAVGLVLARSATQLEGDSFFVRFLSGIERALTAADYALLLQIVPSGAASALPAYERLAAAGRVDGFLLTEWRPRPALRAALRRPRSRSCSRAGPSGAPFPCVETRHHEGIAPAVAHLVSLGHERIASSAGGRSTSTCGPARRRGAPRWPARASRRAGGVRDGRGCAARAAAAHPAIRDRRALGAASARRRARSCARATRWRSRRSSPRAPRGWPCPTTSPWSGSTIPPWPRSRCLR